MSEHGRSQEITRNEERREGSRRKVWAKSSWTRHKPFLKREWGEEVPRGGKRKKVRGFSERACDGKGNPCFSCEVALAGEEGLSGREKRPAGVGGWSMAEKGAAVPFPVGPFSSWRRKGEGGRRTKPLSRDGEEALWGPVTGGMMTREKNRA